MKIIEFYTYVIDKTLEEVGLDEHKKRAIKEAWVNKLPNIQKLTRKKRKQNIKPIKIRHFLESSQVTVSNGKHNNI